MSYFKDDKGQKSMTRLLVFLAALTAFVLSIGVLIAKVYLLSIKTPENHLEFDATSIVTIITSLLAYAGLKKIFQKREEMKEFVKK